MRTLPTAFSDFQFRDGAEEFVILEITDGTTTWYFGNAELVITEGHVHQLITKFELSESVDIFTKQWSVSDLVVELIDLPFQGEPTAQVTLSDLIGDVVNTVAKLYVGRGPNITALSDCLKRFDGYVIEHPAYDLDKVQIRVVDKSKLANKIIPQTKLSDVLATAITGDANKVVPLVYGSFTKNFSSADHGLAVALPLDSNLLAKCLISDHEMSAITGLFGSISNFDHPMEFNNTTLTTNDTDFTDSAARGTSIPTDDEADIHLYPEGTYTGDIGESDGGFATDYQGAEEHNQNFANLNDMDDSTYMSIYDCYDSGATSTDFTYMLFVCSFKDYATGNNLENQIGYMSALNLQYRIARANASHLWAAGYPEFQYGYGPAGADVITVLSSGSVVEESDETVAVSVIGDPPEWRYNIVWHMKTGSGLESANDKAYPIVFLIRAQSATNATQTGVDADGTEGNSELFRVYHFYLVATFRLRKSITSWWSECAGREFGSWITESSRSVGGFVSGDLIEDPAFIIESILRDELGVTTSEIDTDTFDAAYNSDILARINVYQERDAFDVIRQLAEQSTFAFFWASSGQVKLIPLNDKTPTTNRTIRFSEIKEGSLKVSKTPVYAHKMTMKSRYQQEYGKYRDESVIEHSSSDGTRHYEANWPNIDGTSAVAIGEHLITDSDAIWANPHIQIEFALMGSVHSDIEIGDWIEMDSTTFDPQKKCYGASWSGKQFLVDKIGQDGDGITLTALELYEA